MRIRPAALASAAIDSHVVIAIIGFGAMGTALADALCRAGHRPDLLATAYDEAFVRAYREGQPHPGTGRPFPDGIALHEHERWDAALAAAEVVIVVVATAGLVATVREAAGHASPGALWGVATKGWDEATLRPAAGVVADELGDPKRVVTLVGPSLAAEISAGVPTAIVAASEGAAAARRVAGLFSGPMFRVYTSDDVAGVEVGAALKNVIAIAVGMVDGLRDSYGVVQTLNAQAFLFSRGLVEMSRLARALGGRTETVLGLAGAGDLFVTCLGGRNGRFGRLVGGGIAPREALAQMNTTVEGYQNARAAVALADRHGLDLPIVRAVASVIYDGASPRDAIESLIAGAVEPEL